MYQKKKEKKGYNIFLSYENDINGNIIWNYVKDPFESVRNYVKNCPRRNMVKLNSEQGWKEQRNIADLFKYLAT